MIKPKTAETRNTIFEVFVSPLPLSELESKLKQYDELMQKIFNKISAKNLVDEYAAKKDEMYLGKEYEIKQASKIIDMLEFEKQNVFNDLAERLRVLMTGLFSGRLISGLVQTQASINKAKEQQLFSKEDEVLFSAFTNKLIEYGCAYNKNPFSDNFGKLFEFEAYSVDAFKLLRPKPKRVCPTITFNNTKYGSDSDYHSEHLKGIGGFFKQFDVFVQPNTLDDVFCHHNRGKYVCFDINWLEHAVDNESYSLERDSKVFTSSNKAYPKSLTSPVRLTARISGDPSTSKLVKIVFDKILTDYKDRINKKGQACFT